MMRERFAVVAGGAAFCLVAILNCGGYRYGIGDQAFYVPAIVQHLDAGLFPRDRLLLHAQDRFMVLDDALAGLTRMTGLPVPWVFFGGYLLAMVLLFGGLVALGRAMYRSSWTVVLLTAVLTLRHRITQTGANTLESYFQPRMMAFALGVWALAAFLRGKGTMSLVLIVIACATHPTTGLWFGIWIAVALAVTDVSWRVPIFTLVAGASAVAVWLVSFGPLRGHLARIDPQWASVMAGKDYIFPADWGPSFWLINFGYLAVAVLLYQMRRHRGVAAARELGLIVGGAALVAAFLLSWPMMSSGIALALQLQTSRIFWMLDLLASLYIAWLLAEVPPARVRRAIVALVVSVAVLRGVYVMRAEHAGDPILQVHLKQDAWTDAMHWIASTPIDSHVLADPGHAWKYGTSVRVAGERDVFLEEVKDTAVALYSRQIAMWVLGRIQDAQHFESLTAEQFQTLAERYELNYLVVDRDIELPLVYRNEQFRIYRLGHPTRD
jgi:hypothetical protein